MYKIYLAKFLMAFRNMIWDIRKAIRKDVFEKGRTEQSCGCISLYDFEGYYMVFEDQLESLIKLVSNISGKDCGENFGLPELNCVMQYEESDQLFSAHWYISDQKQLHVRFFRCLDSEITKILRDVEVRAHIEWRPDYAPLKHVLGHDVTNGCELFWKLYHAKKKTEIYRRRKA